MKIRTIIWVGVDCQNFNVINFESSNFGQARAIVRSLWIGLKLHESGDLKKEGRNLGMRRI